LPREDARRLGGYGVPWKDGQRDMKCPENREVGN